MKGLSPLVATVLLIAVTMTIAGLLAYWVSTFVKSGLPEKNQTQTMQECAAASFEIYQQIYNSTTKNLTLILQNTGGVDLSIQNVTFIYPGGSVDTKSINQKLPSASLKSFVVSGVTANYSEYTIFTTCPGVYKRWPP